jgi:hypothetical protein
MKNTTLIGLYPKDGVCKPSVMRFIRNTAQPPKSSPSHQSSRDPVVVPSHHLPIRRAAIAAAADACRGAMILITVLTGFIAAV